MSWAAAFWKPIRLHDGRALVTLEDARELISTLPLSHRGADHWRLATELLSHAATSNSAMDDALSAMLSAVKVEKMGNPSGTSGRRSRF